MAKIVEFIGPSGIGKSTTYRELDRLWSSDAKWITLSRATAAQQRTLRRRLVSGLFLLARKFEGPHGGVSLYLGRKTESLRSFEAKRPAFMNLLWSGIAARKPAAGRSDHRIELLSFLLRLCADVEIADQWSKSDYCILEEGLIHNFRSWALADHSQVAAGLDAFPIPDIVFRFFLPIEEIVRRNIARGKGCYLDEGLDYTRRLARLQQTVEVQEVIVDHLSRRGKTVIGIDASQTPQSNAAKIRDILEHL